MSNENQSIAVICSKVKPFRAVADDTDYVVINPVAFGPPPSFQVIFGKYTPGTPEVLGTPEVPQKSGPGLPGYEPFKPAVPSKPAVAAQFTPHRPPETYTLTQAEWDNWNNSISDNDYILSIIAQRTKQVLVP